MGKENNITGLMAILNSKENIKREKEMEKEKNIILVVKYHLKVNI